MASGKKERSVSYTTRILKFGKKGEKSGWTYIEIPEDVASALLPGNRKSFRVKGRLDDFPISGIALLPMGDGAFIMPLNTSLRKGIGKREGAILKVWLEHDEQKPKLSREMMKCLADEPSALAFFRTLAKSHQNYFSKWIESAKTPETKANRIARTINALSKKMGYGEMLRAGKANK